CATPAASKTRTLHKNTHKSVRRKIMAPLYLLAQSPRQRIELFSVRHPDVFNLSSMLHKVAALGLCRIEPVDVIFIIGPDLLQVAYRRSLHHRRVSRIPEA